ncbi:RdgB/HAM1 family non-canonical purine NTP pyrophosphatase [Acetobacter thailandicus]|uniref:RdgB/HAM1 family non-canonical purine NTP pyrophosphatase n=1 Tax=Acetobacter thailandicus TaxID=1502842 RepID=UPI001BA5520E|nr:RdgB/HAM1 family non-canonical purine NTP pyrophosphatase [Acetobacter thailandicus]MBS0961035.1 RdgB/HAM1 family non-canonical purine NTP pyrophosphatase [Acetobacter thailandicus]
MSIPLLHTGDKLVLASHNAGKLAEFSAMLKPFGITVISAGELKLPEPEETETTFTGNAALKAQAAAKASGLPALSDDSGLCVAALNGDPGIYSARWAGPDKNFPAAMARIHNDIGTGERAAWFICVLCLAFPDGRLHFFEGRTDGQIVWPPRGTNGHGYDPIFAPEGKTLSFAEMTDDEKNALSHRARAFDLFRKACLG